jgi:hypothetical protein
MSFLFWKESVVGRWAVTNIKRGGKNDSQDKRKKKNISKQLWFKPV